MVVISTVSGMATISAEKAELMGMIAADGYLFCGRGKGSDRKLRYFVRSCDPCPEMRRRFGRLVLSIYGIRSMSKSSEIVITAYGKSMAVDLARSAGFGTYKWTVPVTSMDRNATRAWLRAYFDGDGDVKMGRRERYAVVRARSVNLEGLRIVQTALLEQFGIYSRIYRHNSRDPRWSPAFDLSIIRQPDIVRFSDEIGFNHPLKAAKLEQIIKRITN
jgi:intein/homing endonuclease